jgi:hypothetical protein
LKKKAIIVSPINSISDRLASHRSSDSHIYADALSSTGFDITINYGNKIKDYEPYDYVFVYHGSEFQGSLNLFGGVDNLSLAENITALSKVPINKIFSMGQEYPDYTPMFKSRLEKKPSEYWKDVDWKNLSAPGGFKAMQIFSHNWENLIIGDSHTTSLYRPGYVVNPIPFKTLHGILKTGFNDIIDSYKNDFKSIGFYFGNIDIRHHLCRQDGTPQTVAFTLVNNYMKRLTEVKNVHGVNIDVYEVLPIENESRKIPKTGWYDGTPFYGSWKERTNMRNLFNNYCEQQCKELGFNFIKWTDYLINKNNELDFKFMEKPQSVHLSREFYPYWNGIEPKTKQNNLRAFFNDK